MKRECYAVIGISHPWQELRAAVFLKDGRRAAVKMPLATFPPPDPIPAETKREMWRACVLQLRLGEL